MQHIYFSQMCEFEVIFQFMVRIYHDVQCAAWLACSLQCLTSILTGVTGLLEVQQVSQWLTGTVHFKSDLKHMVLMNE